MCVVCETATAIEMQTKDGTKEEEEEEEEKKERKEEGKEENNTLTHGKGALNITLVLKKHLTPPILGRINCLGERC